MKPAKLLVTTTTGLAFYIWCFNWLIGHGPDGQMRGLSREATVPLWFWILFVVFTILWIYLIHRFDNEN